MSTPNHLIPLTAQPRFSMYALRTNAATIQYARSSLAFISGGAAGILGLHGYLHGFLFYLVASTLLSSLLFLRTGGKPSKFFATPDALWVAEVSGNAFSFMLFWTLAYGLVHVYD
ncbi:ER membrane complex subunit 6 [Thoreauomyces humboldtii]|nr:ER membrane complex subunit 6 [Thoreauomyces humboldtii]